MKEGLDIDGVNGKTEVINGETYWMGAHVKKMPALRYSANKRR